MATSASPAAQLQWTDHVGRPDRRAGGGSPPVAGNDKRDGSAGPRSDRPATLPGADERRGRHGPRTYEGIVEQALPAGPPASEGDPLQGRAGIARPSCGLERAGARRHAIARASTPCGRTGAGGAYGDRTETRPPAIWDGLSGTDRSWRGGRDDPRCRRGPGRAAVRGARKLYAQPSFPRWRVASRPPCRENRHARRPRGMCCEAGRPRATRGKQQSCVARQSRSSCWGSRSGS